MTRYATEVEVEHVGRRVTLRHWIDDEGRRMHTDVIGDLVAADETTFTVRRRSGDVVVVDRAMLVASRLLPPAPEPRNRRAGP